MTETSTDFTLQELQVIAAAREIKDGERVIIGTGLPLLAANLAKTTHAPNMVSIYESGVIDSKSRITPLSVAEASLVAGSAMQGGLIEGLGIVHAGEVEVGFIGGAQIDKFGNLNAHVIGDYYNPTVRLAGSGGANDIGSCCERTIIIMPHNKKRFVEKVDFITTPGYLTGMDSRDKMRFPGSGPSLVVSSLGLLRFDRTTKEMYLETYHPGVTIEMVKENTSWDMIISDNVKETEPPTIEEIRILREELDPHGLFLKNE